MPEDQDCLGLEFLQDQDCSGLGFLGIKMVNVANKKYSDQTA